MSLLFVVQLRVPNFREAAWSSCSLVPTVGYPKSREALGQQLAHRPPLLAIASCNAWTRIRRKPRNAVVPLAWRQGTKKGDRSSCWSSRCEDQQHSDHTKTAAAATSLLHHYCGTCEENFASTRLHMTCRRCRLDRRAQMQKSWSEKTSMATASLMPAECQYYGNIAWAWLLYCKQTSAWNQCWSAAQVSASCGSMRVYDSPQGCPNFQSFRTSFTLWWWCWSGSNVRSRRCSFCNAFPSPCEVRIPLIADLTCHLLRQTLTESL